MAKINKDDLKIGVTITNCKDCDRVEVVRGCWVEDNKCSVCGFRTDVKYIDFNCKGDVKFTYKLFRYCPDCGAKMYIDERRSENENT